MFVGYLYPVATYYLFNECSSGQQMPNFIGMNVIECCWYEWVGIDMED